MSGPQPPADLHTHVWDPSHLSASFRADLERIRPGASEIAVDPEAHASSGAVSSRTVVVAFDGAHSGLHVPDEYVARYVARDPERLIGFCSVDPTARDPRDAIAAATQELGLRGVKLAPTYQGFDPLGRDAFLLYEEIAAHELPVLWHQGAAFVRASVLAYAPPMLIDEVARRHPEMRIVIAHLGSPWVDECLAVVRKHPSVFADVSGIVHRPGAIRAALTTAAELGCDHRLLFGTDWPFSTVDAVVEALAACAGDDDLPQAARDAADGILRRDAVAAVGL